MGGLDDYTGPGETIRLRFGMSIQFFVFQILIIALGAFLLAWFPRDISYFMWIVTGTGAIGIVYYALIFFATRYFVTEKEIYKRTGIFWTKVVSVKQDEIENMEASQPFLAGKFFNMGTLIFSTSGTTAFQMIVKNVSDPFRRRKQIEAVWNIPPTP